MGLLDTIHGIRSKRLELARLDPRGGMPSMPPPPASSSALQAVERRLGFALPASYRAFLSAHDGWPGFFHGANLLSTAALARGTYMSVGRMAFAENTAELEDGPISVARAATGFVPFGIDAQAEMVFGWDPARPEPSGELRVIYWIHGVGDTAPSFLAFLEFVLEMLDAELVDRQTLPVRSSAHPRAPEARRLATPRPSAIRAA
jgi:hypothetical protein